MVDRFRTFALFFAVLVLATGAGRTAHMILDHGPGGACSVHVSAASSHRSHDAHDHHSHACDGSAHHHEEPIDHGPSDEHEHGEDTSCDLCAVLAAMSSPDAGQSPEVVQTAEWSIELPESPVFVARSCERLPRSSRGPPVTG